MEEVVSFLKNSGVQYCATVGLDGRPKVRPFQFMYEEGGRFWFCTSNQKEIYKELQNHPFVELCTADIKMSWLRLSGKVIFSDSMAAKEKVLEISALVKKIYKVPENPAFEVFYLEDAKASITEIGKTPRIFAL